MQGEDRVNKREIILDNIIFGLQRSGGISRYWQEIISRLIEDVEFSDLSFLEPKNSGNNIFRLKLVIPGKKIRTQLQIPSLVMQFLPARLDAPAVFHSSYYRYAVGKGIKNVLTIHDCIYELFRGGSIVALLHKIRMRSLRYADVVICVSKNTANDLMKYYPEINRNNVHVIYNGVAREYGLLNRSDDNILINGRMYRKGSYLLYVGKRNGYKNFSILINALIEMKRGKKELPYVILAGGENEYTREQQDKINSNKLNGLFMMVGKCQDEYLNNLYNYALAYVCTSLYEGFGLSVIEAMKAGCPVISANNSSLIELAKGAALLYNDMLELIDSIQSMGISSARNNLVSEGVKRAAGFSWDRTYKETKDIYLSLL